MANAAGSKAILKKLHLSLDMASWRHDATNFDFKCARFSLRANKDDKHTETVRCKDSVQEDKL